MNDPTIRLIQGENAPLRAFSPWINRIVGDPKTFLPLSLIPMAEPLSHYLIPNQPPAANLLEVYQETHAFYQEVHHRQALEAYCQWYYQVAAEHQQDLKKMRRELNIFGWFIRRG